MALSYIGLGSNLKDRKKNIATALKHLEQDADIDIIQTSSFIETKPHNSPAQPNFLNCIVKIETTYSAQQLLNKLQEIEAKLGRKKPYPKNSPRTIDLDILIFGDLKIDEADLQIPHPEMWQRKFVTVPLKEVAPELFTKT